MEKNEIANTGKNELVKADDVIRAYQPTEMLKTHSHIKTIQDAVKSNGSGLSKLTKDIGSDRIQALIELHIWQLNSTMNLQNKLNETQVMEIAIEIMSMYYYLTMEDIYLIFRKAKRGEWGKVYGSLSMIDVFEWFSKYDLQRTEFYVNKNTENRHNDSSPRSSEKDSEAMHIARLTNYSKDIKKDSE